MNKGNNVVKVGIKKLVAHAQIPEYATEGSVGMDLVATDYRYDYDKKVHEYGTGIALQLPVNFEAQIRPRSSISKTSLILANSVGTIDTDYTGELIVKFKEIDDRGMFYEVGDRIAQLIIVPVPKIKLVEIQELSSTERGTGGFGSTGR